ncbi:MAG: hypothetical protein MRY83_08395 [Flavobacteriales bacterium]|nr:hypothetical protein [Flavobacteriales bacterium]
MKPNYLRIFVFWMAILHGFTVFAQIRPEFRKSDSLFYHYLTRDVAQAKNVLDSLSKDVTSIDERALLYNMSYSYYNSTGNRIKAKHFLDSIEFIGLDKMAKSPCLFRYYRNKGKFSFVERDLENARIFYNKALDVAEEKRQFALIFYSLAGTFEIIDEYDSAHYYIDLALSKDSTGEISGHIFNVLGRIQYKHGKYELAIDYLLKSSKLFGDFENLGMQATVKNNIGIMYSLLNRLDEGEVIFLEVLNESQHGDRNYLSARVNLSGIWSRQGKCDSVQKYADELQYLFSENIKKHHGKLIALNQSLLRCALSKGEYEKAKKIAMNSVTVSEEYGTDATKLTALIGLGKATIMSDKNAGVKILSEAMQKATEQNSKRKVLEICNVLYAHYEDIGDDKNSLKYYRLADLTEDSLVRDSLLLLAADLNAQHERVLAERDKRIAEDELKIANSDRSRKRLWISLLSSVMIIVMSLSLFLISSYRKKRDKAIEFQKNLEKELVQIKDNILQKNKVIGDLESKLEKQEGEELSMDLLSSLKVEQDWVNFMSVFESRYPELWKFLKSKTELTITDYRFCALLRLDLTTHEIADLLSITYAGVKKAKQRIRKKLDLDIKERLVDFLNRI